MIEAGKEDALATLDLIDDHLSRFKLKAQGLEYGRRRDFQKLRGLRQQVIAWQAAMPLIKSLRQGKGDPRPGSDHRGLFDAKLHGDRIGGPEANSPDVARQAIRIFRDQLDGIGAISLVDPYRTRCANTIGVEEDHDLADCPLIGPGESDAIGALWPNAAHLPQPMRLGFNDVEDLAPESPDKAPGIDRADTADHARAKIFLDPFDCRGRHRF